MHRPDVTRGKPFTMAPYLLLRGLAFCVVVLALGSYAGVIFYQSYLERQAGASLRTEAAGQAEQLDRRLQETFVALDQLAAQDLVRRSVANPGPRREALPSLFRVFSIDGTAHSRLALVGSKLQLLSSSGLTLRHIDKPWLGSLDPGGRSEIMTEAGLLIATPVIGPEGESAWLVLLIDQERLAQFLDPGVPGARVGFAPSRDDSDMALTAISETLGERRGALRDEIEASAPISAIPGLSLVLSQSEAWALDDLAAVKPVVLALFFFAIVMAFAGTMFCAFLINRSMAKLTDISAGGAAGDGGDVMHRFRHEPAEISSIADAMRALTVRLGSAEERLKAEQKANRAKSDFVARMCRDLRTPINDVIGLAGILKHGDLDDEQRDTIDTIRRSSDSQLAILGQILDYTRMETGRVKLSSSDFELNSVIDSVVEVLAPTARDKGIELSAVVLSNSPVLLHGDAGRLRQLLLNLVDRAIRYTDYGGVMIQVGPGDDLSGPPMVRFEVTDTGSGLAAEEFDQLFGQAARDEPIRTDQGANAALGLAICRELIQLMEGRMGAASEMGRGSRIWFEVPMGDSGDMEFETDLLVGQEIVVIERNEIAREALSRQLGSFGASVLRTSSTTDGLAAVRDRASSERPYGLVLLGTDTIRDDTKYIKALRRAAGSNALRVVLIADSEAEIPSLRKTFDLDDVLLRPLRRTTVMRCVIAVLEPKSIIDMDSGRMAGPITDRHAENVVWPFADALDPMKKAGA